MTSRLGTGISKRFFYGVYIYSTYPKPLFCNTPPRPLLPEGGHAGALAERGLGDVVLQVLVEVALVAVLAHHEGQLGV